MKANVFLQKKIGINGNGYSKISFSPHLSIYATFSGCDPKLLSDEKFVIVTILGSLIRGDMRLIDLFYHKYEEGGKGITATAIISDSHVIVNTYPELTMAVIDIYACSGRIIDAFYEFVRRFKPKNIDFSIVPRGFNKNIIKHKTVLKKSHLYDSELSEWLKERNLLLLTNSSEEFLSILNVMGFVMGNGYIKNDLSYCVIRQDDRNILEVLKKRLEDIKVYPQITVKQKFSKIYFELKINDKNFCKLLNILGVPKGRNNKKEFPKIIEKEKIEIKSLFLAGFLQTFYKVRKKTFFNRNGNQKIVLKGSKNFIEKIKDSLSKLKIDSEIKKCDNHFKLEISLTKENSLRVEILLSLNKIYPTSVFSNSIPDVSFDTKLKFAENLNFYKVLNKLWKGNGYSKKLLYTPREDFKLLVKKMAELNIVKVFEDNLILNIEGLKVNS